MRTFLRSNNTAAVQQFWDVFVAASRPDTSTFRIWAFGDGRELSTELAALVLAGTKRGAATLRRSFDASGEPLPKPGDFSVVVDGSDVPCCVVRTVEIETKPLGDVDARFAWEEGEGDGSLGWWLSAHTRYFKRQGLREGFSVDRRTEVVLVRFEVVWPAQFVASGTDSYAKS